MGEKKITVISSKINMVTGLESAKNVLGKKVYSKSGDYIGVIKDLLYSGATISGIMVRRGFTNIFIDKEYLGKSPDDVLFLTIEPFVLMLGKQVFDVKGRLIGKVKNVKRASNRNAFTALIVKKNIVSKPIEVQSSEIATMKTNIILNIAIEIK